MKWYKKKEKPGKMRIYDGSWAATLLFKARTNSLEVNERKKRWGGIKETCEGCERRGNREIETLEHMMVECETYEKERKMLEKEMEGVMGKEEWERVKRTEGRGMVEVLSIEREDQRILEKTKGFLAKVWGRRNRIEKGERGEERRVGEGRIEHNYHVKEGAG